MRKSAVFVAIALGVASCSIAQPLTGSPDGYALGNPPTSWTPPTLVSPYFARQGQHYLSNGVPTEYQSSFDHPQVVASDDGSTLLAAWGPNEYTYGDGIGASVSLDGGITWQAPVNISQVLNDWPRPPAPFLAISDDGTTMLAAWQEIVDTFPAEDYRIEYSVSSDRGSSWSSPRELPRLSDGDCYSVTDVAMAGDGDKMLIAATSVDCNTGDNGRLEVFQSGSLGESWNRHVVSQPSEEGGGFQIRISEDFSTVFATWTQFDPPWRAYTSTSSDGGVTWSQPFRHTPDGWDDRATSIALSPDGQQVCVLIRRVDNLLGGETQNILTCSSDAGLTWAGGNEMPTHEQEPQIVAPGDSQSELVVSNIWAPRAEWGGQGYDLTLFESDDNGESWDTIGVVASSQWQMNAVAGTSSDGKTIYALWSRYDGSYRLESSSSSDGGQTWTDLAEISYRSRRGIRFNLHVAADGTRATVVWVQEDSDFASRIYSSSSPYLAAIPDSPPAIEVTPAESTSDGFGFTIIGGDSDEEFEIEADSGTVAIGEPNDVGLPVQVLGLDEGETAIVSIVEETGLSSASTEERSGTHIAMTTPSSNAAVFWRADLPSVSSTTALAASSGDRITLTGVNLSSVSRVILRPSFVAAFSVVNDTTLQVTVPTGASSGRIKVANGIGYTMTDFDLTVGPTRSATVTINGQGDVLAGTHLTPCSSRCDYKVANGAIMDLVARARQGSVFTGWSGACSGMSLTCRLSLTANKTTSANFTRGYALTVSKAGTGSGSIVSSVGGINCGSTCTATIAQNVQVTLTATAGSGSKFTGWSGACRGSSPTCKVSMNAAKSASAAFTLPPQYALTVSKAGTGSGSIVSSVGGINCGSTCTATVTENVQVTLTATAGSRSRFTGWSGACRGSSPTCKVSMNAAKSVVATFRAN